MTRQCEILHLNRTGVYCTPRPVSKKELDLVRRIDALRLAQPFHGARKLAPQQRREGREVGRLHVTTLLRKMGIEAIHRTLRSSA